MVIDTTIKKGYKQTEIGVIPEDWGIEPIKQLATITTGSKNTQDRIPEGLYPFFVRSQTIERINSYSYDGEAVLTAGDGVGTGKVFHYINGKFDIHQRVYKISDFNKKLNGYFFFLYFSNNFFNRIMQMTAKSSVDSVRMEMIADMQIPVPTKSEQTAIATVLSDTDALIEHLEKLIVKKKAIKQGAMQQLLTGKKRLPGFSGKWVTKELGELVDVKDGTHQTPKYFDSGIPFYSVESVTNNDFTNTKYISETEHKLLTKKFKIEEMDILMTRIGSIGDCKLITWRPNASFYVSLALLKPKNKSNAPYIYHFSKTSFFKKELKDRSLQWAIPKKINLGEISKVNICIPKEEPEQTAIATVLSDMDSEIESLEQKRDKYIMIRQGMMQQLLTGRIRIYANN